MSAKDDQIPERCKQYIRFAYCRNLWTTDLGRILTLAQYRRKHDFTYFEWGDKLTKYGFEEGEIVRS